jgi:ligand-binding sensor domain-containing protein
MALPDTKSYSLYWINIRLIILSIINLTWLVVCASPSSNQSNVDLQKTGGWTQTIWNQKAGLQQSTVTSFVLSKDQSLWLSTFAGIARFDGETVIPFSLKKDQRSLLQISTLSKDPHRQGLWIGTVGRGIWYLKKNQLTQVYLSPLNLNLTIYKIVSTPQGQIWVASDQGVFFLNRAGEWENLSSRATFDVDLLSPSQAWICSIGRVELINQNGQKLAQYHPDKKHDAGNCRGGVVDSRGQYWALFEKIFTQVDTQGNAHILPLSNLKAVWMNEPFF